MALKSTKTFIDGLIILEVTRYSDNRGWFAETWNKKNLSEHGINVDFVQDNHSCSVYENTIRGMHCQTPPNAQDKLVSCTKGAILDVAVDIRKNSATYGKWFSVKLTPENAKQLFIPKGFLHGFLTLEPNTEVQYKCSDYYNPGADCSVKWDSMNIDWPVGANITASEKDALAGTFSNFNSPF